MYAAVNDDASKDNISANDLRGFALVASEVVVVVVVVVGILVVVLAVVEVV